MLLEIRRSHVLLDNWKSRSDAACGVVARDTGATTSRDSMVSCAALQIVTDGRLG